MQEEPQPLSVDKFSAARRRFLKFLIGIMTFFMSVLLGIPFIRALITSRSGPAQQTWERVGDVDSLPIGQPVRMNFFARIEDAYRHETTVHSVWVVKRSREEVTVFSPICTHLGCYFKWDAGTGHFECPCHGSVFSIDGKVLGGPAPRPLDTLPAKIEDGKLLVSWEQFKVGIPEKVPV